MIVSDTSILVRATKRPNGPARKAIDALAADRDHVIALSAFILGEVGKVLSYRRMQALYRLTVHEIHDHVQFLRSISCLVEPSIGMPIVLSDPADDLVVYTAVAAGVDVLCVKDRDLYESNVVACCRRQDIQVMDDLTRSD